MAAEAEITLTIVNETPSSVAKKGSVASSNPCPIASNAVGR
jgi:hypothetical protein